MLVPLRPVAYLPRWAIMRCHFVGTEGCLGETPVMFQLQPWGQVLRRGEKPRTVPCCSACWRILTDGATAPEPEAPKRMQAPQRPRKEPQQLGLPQRAVVGEKPQRVRLSEDLFG